MMLALKIVGGLVVFVLMLPLIWRFLVFFGSLYSVLLYSVTGTGD